MSKHIISIIGVPNPKNRKRDIENIQKILSKLKEEQTKKDGGNILVYSERGTHAELTVPLQIRINFEHKHILAKPCIISSKTGLRKMMEQKSTVLIAFYDGHNQDMRSIIDGSFMNGKVVYVINTVTNKISIYV